MNSNQYSRWSVLLLCLFLLGCSSRKADFVERLGAAVRSTRLEQLATIDLCKITNFEWDRVFIFGPYTTPATIQDELGYNWPEATRSGIQASEGLALVVFVHEGKVTKYFNVSRSVADFMDLERKHIFARDESIFEVGRSTEVMDSKQRTRFTLTPQGATISSVEKAGTKKGTSLILAN